MIYKKNCFFRFSISAVKVFWEISKLPTGVTAQGSVPDEGYEWKVLTAYVETARGRTILRGTRPPDLVKYVVSKLGKGDLIGYCLPNQVCEITGVLSTKRHYIDNAKQTFEFFLDLTYWPVLTNIEILQYGYLYSGPLGRLSISSIICLS
jgi:hypothetical protein